MISGGWKRITFPYTPRTPISTPCRSNESRIASALALAGASDNSAAIPHLHRLRDLPFLFANGFQRTLQHVEPFIHLLACDYQWHQQAYDIGI
jgi:hypothetical protein